MSKPSAKKTKKEATPKVSTLVEKIREDLAKTIPLLTFLETELGLAKQKLETLTTEIIKVRGQQESLGPLFLGDRMVSADNPDGITLQKAYEDNLDNLKTLSEKYTVKNG